MARSVFGEIEDVSLKKPAHLGDRDKVIKAGSHRIEKNTPAPVRYVVDEF